MAAYAAVVSLINTVKQLQNHDRLSTYFDKEQIKSLLEKLGPLQDLVERYSHGRGEEALEREREIARAAYDAEDLIESHVADRILGCSQLLDLQRVIEDLDSKVKKIWDVQTVEDQPCSEKPKASSTRSPPNSKKTAMVGFKDEKIKILESLLDGLTSGRKSLRQVISIVGMGGAGKSTLARSIHEDPCIVSHFDIRIWVVVSQKYNMRDLLLQIPVCRNAQDQSDEKLEDQQLGLALYQKLFGRRYLIILDDIWRMEVCKEKWMEDWNELNRFFPTNDDTVGRIVVTTRDIKVAETLSSKIFKLNFLEKDESWKLFCETAFTQETCPLGLVVIGKKISRRCKGHPLSIVVIGGLLASCAKLYYWISVAKALSSSPLNSEVDKVLSLSYSHLPVHLKPCFLYMGVFPEDEEIKVSELIKLWIAEGFLKPDGSESLEETAEGYLNDLVDRNLILVHKRRWNGRIKTCGIHDLLHDLCLREAREESFCVRKRFRNDGVCKASKYWRLHDAFDSLRSRDVQKMPENHVLSKKDKLLRVLKNVRGRPHDIFGGINLRYICYTYYNLNWLLELPSSIFRPWNLQTLIYDSINVLVRAPIEIWDVPQLRHVEFPYIYLPNPPATNGDECDDFVIKNLQTLKKVVNFEWSEDAINRIQSIKELKIAYMEKLMDKKDYHLNNLRLFKRLESLHVDLRRCRESRRNLSQELKFPDNLKKLTLEHSGLCWDELGVIGSLQRLEIFKHKGVIKGNMWNPKENEFCSLKSLDVENCNDLCEWNAEISSHFPRLENLRFGYVPNLKEFPLEIGDTLKTISLQWCQATAAISLVNLFHEEVESTGNEDLEVCVMLKSSEEERIFRESLDELARKNSHGDEPHEEQVNSEDWASTFHVVEPHEPAAAVVQRFLAPFRRLLLKVRCKKVMASTSESQARDIVAAMKFRDALQNQRTRKALAAATIFQHSFRSCQTQEKFV